MASRRQRLVLSITFRQSDETGEPETPHQLRAQEKCCISGKIPKHCASNAKRFKPPNSSGLLPLANQKHRTRFAQRKSATDCLRSFSEEALFKLTEDRPWRIPDAQPT
jgi:hypothetical protein